MSFLHLGTRRNGVGARRAREAKAVLSSDARQNDVGARRARGGLLGCEHGDGL